MKPSLTRREFIKNSWYLLGCLVLFRFKEISEFKKEQHENTSNLQEAKFYTSGDHLAG